MRVPHKCPLCQGTGKGGPKAETPLHECGACAGTGIVWSGYDDFTGPVVNPWPMYPYPPQTLVIWCSGVTTGGMMFLAGQTEKK